MKRTSARFASAARILWLLIPLFALSASSSAQSAYDLVLLSPLPGATAAGARDVNQHGHVLFMSGDQAALWIDANNNRIAESSEKTLIGELEAGKGVDAKAINGTDDVVGHASVTPIDPNSTDPRDRMSSVAFIWQPGIGLRNLNDLDNDGVRDRSDWGFDSAYDISDSGYIVGTGIYFDGVSWRGVAYRLNLMTGVVDPIVNDSAIVWRYAVGVNSIGQVLFHEGSNDANGTGHFWENGAARALGIAYPNDINQNSRIAGSHYNGSVMRACYLASPTAPIQSLGTLGGYFSAGSAINDAGTLVGDSTTRQGFDSPRRAFRWKPGETRLTDLNRFRPKGSKWELRSAVKISDAGWIVGDASDGVSLYAYVYIPR